MKSSTATEHVPMKQPRTSKKNPDRVARIGRRQRGNLTILHFLLTSPRWSITFFVLLASYRCPIQVYKEGWEKPLLDLRRLLDLEGSSYQHCVSESKVSVQKDIAERLKDAELDALTVQAENAGKIRAWEEHVARVVAMLRTTTTFLQQWQIDGRDLDLSPFCNSTETLRHEEINSVTSSTPHMIARNWTGILEDERERFNGLERFVKSRLIYDYEYFVESRIEPALRLVENISSIEWPTLQVNRGAIVSEIQEALHGVNSLLQKLLQRTVTLEIRATDLEVQLHDIQMAHLDLLERFEKGVRFVEDLLPPGTPLPAFLEFQSPPNLLALLPPLQSSDLELLSIEDIITTTVGNILLKVESLIRDISLDIDQKGYEFLEILQANLGNMLRLEDYDPPSYDRTYRQEVLLSEVTASVDVQNLTLPYSTGQLTTPVADDDEVGSMKNNSSSLLSEMVSIPNSTTTFEYLQPLLPALDIRSAISTLKSWFEPSLWMLELVIQAWRLWKIERVYGKHGTSQFVGLQGKGKRKLSVLVPLMLLFATLMLRVQIELATNWLGNTADCQDPRERVFLVTPLLFPLLVNDANSRGNVNFLQAEAECINMFAGTCSRRESAFLDTYHDGVDALARLKAEYQTSMEDHRKVTACLSEGTIQEIETACCGLKGYQNCTHSESTFLCPPMLNMRPQNNTLDAHRITNKDRCRAHTLAETLQVPSFSCAEILGICKALPCDGVNEEGLHDETLRAACALEKYALEALLFSMLVLYHSCAVGACSGFLLSGMRRHFWRDLHGGQMNLIRQMREDGSLVPSTTQTKAQRLSQINATSKALKRAGKVEILIGFCIFLAWISSIT